MKWKDEKKEGQRQDYDLFDAAFKEELRKKEEEVKRNEGNSALTKANGETVNVAAEDKKNPNETVISKTDEKTKARESETGAIPKSSMTPNNNACKNKKNNNHSGAEIAETSDKQSAADDGKEAVKGNKMELGAIFGINLDDSLSDDDDDDDDDDDGDGEKKRKTKEEAEEEVRRLLKEEELEKEEQAERKRKMRKKPSFECSSSSSIEDSDEIDEFTFRLLDSVQVSWC